MSLHPYKYGYYTCGCVIFLTSQVLIAEFPVTLCFEITIPKLQPLNERPIPENGGQMFVNGILS